jgi:hypothetical protein
MEQIHFVLQHTTYINSYMFRRVRLCCNKSLKMVPQRRNMYEFMYVIRVVSKVHLFDYILQLKNKGAVSLRNVGKRWIIRYTLQHLSGPESLISQT